MRPRILLLLLAVLAASVGYGLWPTTADSLPRVSARTPAAPDFPTHSKHIPSPASVGRAPAKAVPPTASEFTAFNAWTAQYLAATPAEQTRLVSAGLKLAGERRAALAELIRTNPEQALAAAVPMVTRAKLPAELQPVLEERVSGRGNITLVGVAPRPGHKPAEPQFRIAEIDGREFHAYTYGRRAQAPRVSDASIHGIAIDGFLAVAESPVRVLEPGETAAGRPVESICPISGIATPGAENAALSTPGRVAVEADGKIYVLCHDSHLSAFAARLAAREQVQNAADGAPGSSSVAGRPTQTWTHGPKKILLIRVDFSDVAGTPVNPSDGQTISEDYVVNRFNLAGGVRDFYEQNSFSKTTLVVGATVAGNSPDVTSVLRMPATAASYATAGNNAKLHTDARNLATGAGFNLANYDRIGVIFADLSGIAGSKIDYGGLGNIDGPDFWINGYFDFSIVAHEIGHTYGLNHANLWQVSDGNPVSAAGSSTEYGDVFDVMGDGTDATHHFTHWNKSILQWIPDTAVNTVTTSGTYRVYRFDAQGANLANALALKVVRNATQDYWIGFRRATTNAALDNGAYVIWGYNQNQQGNLLDLKTPGTNVNDCALQVGSSFNDTAAGITFTTLARGGSGNDEWLDVQVAFQPRIQFSAPIFVADEQGGTATVTLTRTNNASGAVSVNYATATGTATAADFTAKSGTVTWNDGDLTPKTITIAVTPDAIVEGTENFTVNLSGVSGGVINGSTSATVTIADAGAADPQFSADFINSTIEKLLVLPDGKILAAGWFDSLQDVSFIDYTRGGIARFKSDGSIDPDFGVDGGVFGPNSPRVLDFARQPDGKIIIGGEFTAVNGITRTRVARLLADGSLDPTFDPGTGPNDTVNAVLLQPDGKIVLGGYFTTVNGSAARLLVRLNANGTVDAGFTPPTFGSGTGWRVESLARQSDGKILVGGSFYFSGSPFKASICRVLATGVLDPGFNGVTNGAHLAGDTTTIRSVEKIVLLTDGTMLIAGDFTAYNNVAKGGIAKLSATGSLDSSFTATTNGRVATIRRQPDGKVLLGGDFTTVNGAAASRLARVSSTGATDTAFLAAGGHADTVEELVLQPDGRVLLGGNFGSFHGSTAESPLWRFYAGLPGLPGVVQLSTETAIGVEGTSLTLTATRTGGSLGALSVNYATVAGTATAADFTSTTGTLSWADGDSANKTISIPITADSLADSGETLVLNLGEGLIGSALLGTTQQTNITIDSAFTAWQAANFTPAELADSSISGDLADPDGDRRTNLIEFALGSNPHVPDAPATGLSTTNVSGSNYLTITFRRRNPLLDLAYTVQNGASLTIWGNTAVQVGSAVSNGDGTDTVTFRDSVPLTGSTQRFMRVQVQRTP